MEIKKFNKFELSTIKRTAQNVNPMVSRKNRIKARMSELLAKYNQLSEAQEQFEAPIRTITGGYSSEDLVEKVVEDTGRQDKNGNEIKVTKWVFRYPDTIIPPQVSEDVVGIEENNTIAVADMSEEEVNNIEETL